MKFKFIFEHRNEFSILRMCRVLDVKRGSYYAWERRPVSKRLLKDVEITERIKTIYEQSYKTYGSPKIWNQMKKSGYKCSRKRIARLMKANNIRSIIQKRYRVKGKAIKEDEASLNILNRQFNPDKANKAWVMDITYIPTKSGWVYACVVIDLYSKSVVGYSTSSIMTTELVIEAFTRAIIRRNPAKGLIVHSDRGAQFASGRFREKLLSYGCIQSMSRKGNCWDNACVESFFHLLKSERLNFYRFENLDQVKWALFKYIEGFYNTIRIHSSLGYLSPAEYESNFIA